MKKQLLGILLLIFALSVVFLIMSCAPATQNTNVASNANAMSSSVVKPTKPCTKSSVDSDANLMVNAADLKNQHEGTGNQYGHKNFDFRVIEVGPQKLKVLLIQGGISDGKKNEPDKNSEHMEKFIKEIDELITKDCVDRAIFVPRGSFARLDRGELRPDDIVGFEWSTCEWPNMPCAGGVCAETCPGMENPTANTAANANTNSANTNVNSANVNGNASNRNVNRTP